MVVAKIRPWRGRRQPTGGEVYRHRPDRDVLRFFSFSHVPSAAWHFGHPLPLLFSTGEVVPQETGGRAVPSLQLVTMADARMFTLTTGAFTMRGTFKQNAPLMAPISRGGRAYEEDGMATVDPGNRFLLQRAARFGMGGR